MTDVSIIFVNYKTKDLTIGAIKSVTENTQGLDYEIFVVDNNSQDGSTEAIEQKYPDIHIIQNTTNAGFGAANNIAIKQAAGKYILCLNTDIILNNNAIKLFFDFMEKEENQQTGACGAYLTDGDNEPTNCGGLLPDLLSLFWKFGFNRIFRNFDKKFFNGKITQKEKYLFKNLGYITGADLFIRKKVLDEIGLYDENFFMYYEDTDLCKRIKDKGYKLDLVSDAKIQHLEGKSTTDLLQKRKLSKKSEFYYFKKHHPQKVWFVKIIYIILYLIDWLILGHKDGKEILVFIIKNF